MSEEKKIFYKTLNNIVATNRIDNEEAYIINNYVSGLENIIKEVKSQLDYLETYSSKEDVYEDMSRRLNNIEKIIDKENK